MREKIEIAILALGILIGTPLFAYMGYQAGLDEAQAVVDAKK